MVSTLTGRPRWKWWYWFVLSAAWALAGMCFLLFVVQPAIQNQDIRVVVGLVGGLLIGWSASQLGLIGWYSKP